MGGKAMSEWKKVKIDSILEEISMGPFGSDVKKDCYVSSGVPILNGSNLVGFKLNEDAFGYLTPEKADSLGRSNARRGDILVTHRGTLGQIVYIPSDSKYDRYVISQSQFRFRVKPELALPEFIVYYFHTADGQYRLLSNASQVGVPALARATSTFRQLEIPLPCLDVQRKMCDILLALDSQIENNNRINRNLEEQAQALFKSWFVDFEPWGGVMPEDWKEGKVSDIVNILNGFAFKSSSFVDGGNFRLITIKGVQDSYLSLDGAEYIDEIPNKMPEWCKLKKGDILLSLTGNVGRCCVVDQDDLLLNQRVAKLQPYLPYNALFTYLLFRAPSTKKRLEGISRGTAQANLSPIEMGNLNIIIPSELALKDFGEKFGLIIDMIISNSQQSSRLAQLRDTLLPKLMKGEIEV